MSDREAAACPVIAAFLDRNPQLTAAIDEVLACGTAVRQARQTALPDPGLPSPPRSDQFLSREKELWGAVECLESRVEADASANKIDDAVHDVMLASMRLQSASHTYSPPRRTSGRQARAALIRALGEFDASYSRLEQEAATAHLQRLPWQLTFATHIAPGTPVREMEVTGYDLPGTPVSRRNWGERCRVSGTPFHTDSHPRPAIRYRSLDSRCVLAPGYHELFARLRRAMDRVRRSCPEAVQRLARLHPWLYEERLPERCNPTFGKLGLTDFPSLAVSLNNMLRVYVGRPFLGTRGSGGRFSSLGVVDRTRMAIGGEDAGAGYSWETFDEVRQLSLGLAHGLDALGMEPGDRVGITFSTNCREFYLTDFALVFSGLVSIGLQHTMTAEQLAASASRAELRAVVTDSALLARFLDPALRAACPSLELLIVVGQAHGAPPDEEGIRLVSFEKALTDPEQIPQGWRSSSGVSFATPVLYRDRPGLEQAAAEGILPNTGEELFTLMFTSGSTGQPKGTVYTRRRWIEEMRFEADPWPHVDASFLSPALSVDRHTVWQALYNGGRIGFARSGAGLFDDLRAICPTILRAPPAIWNAIATDYREAIADPALDLAVISEIRRRFQLSLGGRVSVMGTGGAPSDPGVRRTMEEIFEVRMIESYATTEVGEIARDGLLLADLDWRLVDVPELGYSGDDQPLPRGELAVRTPLATAHYYNDEMSSREGFTEDGYFLTGDIVEIGPGRACRVIGRRKQFFKLAGSEFVCPEELEDIYTGSELAEAVFVTALSTEAAVVAVVVPTSNQSSAAEILADLRRLARQGELRAHETPVGVVIEPRPAQGMPWTPENGLVTLSYKLARRALFARYSDRIEAAYLQSSSAARLSAVDHGPGDPDRSLLDRLVTLVGAVLGMDPASVDPHRSLIDHGGDSLAAVELRLRLERLLSARGMEQGRDGLADQMEIPLVELAERMRPVHRRPSSPEENRSAPARPDTRATPTTLAPDPKTATRTDATSIAELANSDLATAPCTTDLPFAPGGEDVLLTGATGFLGVHVLAELAADLDCGSRLWALVRAEDHEAARRRLTRALELASLAVPEVLLPDSAQAGGVVAVAGSLDQPQLGLDNDLWARLETDVARIFHVGAVVSAEPGYRDLRAANVEGTRRIIGLALSGALKSVHLVSSFDVAHLLEHCGQKRVGEDTPLPDTITAHMVASGTGYALSKLVGEMMLARAIDQTSGRLRASISRPALISWSSATGFANPSDWLTRLLSSCLQLGMAIGDDEVGPPGWVAESQASLRGLELVPVDFAARALVRLGQLTHDGDLPAAAGPFPPQVPIFHLGNPCPDDSGFITRRLLMDLLVTAHLELSPHAVPMTFAPASELLARVEAERAPLLAMLHVFRQMEPTHLRTSMDRLTEAMAGRGSRPAIACPPTDVEFLEAFVARYS